MKLHNVLVAAAAMAVIAPSALATLVSSNANNNGTIKPAGPRTGASGKAFLNVEGNSNGTNASWGVIDYQFAPVGFTVSDVTSLEVDLVESNAAFTTPGNVSFYLATDLATSIDPGSTIKYLTSVTPPGVDNQLGALYFLGNGAFTTTGNVNSGQVDSYSTSATLSLDAGTKAFIAGSLNGAGHIRLVMTEVEPTVAATWAGYTNSTYAGPKMTLNVTPEPSAIAALAVGCAGLLFRRRK